MKALTANMQNYSLARAPLLMKETMKKRVEGRRRKMGEFLELSRLLLSSYASLSFSPLTIF